MTDKTKPREAKEELLNTKSNINKSTTNALGSSLLGRIHAYKAEAKNNLLIDVSGSMEERVYEEGKSRHEYTTKRSILEDLLTKIPEGVTKYAFSYNVVEFSGKLPFEGSGTDMAKAFRVMKQKGKKEIVLITDGMPDSAHTALQESKGLKIDIIYIGPQPRPDFLEQLARATSGSFTNINLIKANATKELESKVQLLLGS
jgi:hypothetical protein